MCSSDLSASASAKRAWANAKSLGQAIAIDDKFALAHARLAEALAELDYGDKAKDELLRVASLVPDRSLLPLTDGLYLEAINSVVARERRRGARHVR